MADNFRRRAAARMGRNARANLPSRFDFDLGTWLGGEEAAEAEEADRRLQQEFARPLGAGLSEGNTTSLSPAFPLPPVPRSDEEIAQLREYVTEITREQERSVGSNAVSPEEKATILGDAVWSAGAGLREGGETTVGTVGDLREGAKWLGDRAGVPSEFYEPLGIMAKHIPTLQLLAIAPTTEDVQRVTNDWIGPAYQPKYTSGEFIKTGFSFVPAAAAGPGGLVRRLLTQAFLPGIASEAVGQATEGTTWEPFARAATAIATPLAALHLLRGSKFAFDAARRGQAGSPHDPSTAVSTSVQPDPLKMVSEDLDVAGTHRADDLRSGNRSPEALFESTESAPSVEQRQLPYDARALEEVPARVREALENPTVRREISKFIDDGLEIGAKNWYDTEPLRQAFVKVLGEEAGEVAFDKFLAFVAASSSYSEVGTSIKAAGHYRYLLKDVMQRGKDAAQDAIEIIQNAGRPPETYGHWKRGFHNVVIKDFLEKGEFDSETWRKMSRMFANMRGNLEPVTIDTHMFRMLGMLARDPRFLTTKYKSGKNAKSVDIRAKFERGEIKMDELLKNPAYWDAELSPSEYAAYERWFQDLAREKGLRPAEAQVAAWRAGGRMTGLRSDQYNSLLEFIEDRVRRTAKHELRRTEISTAELMEILNGFIRGEFPLRALAGVGLSTGAGITLLPEFENERRGTSARPFGATATPRRNSTDL